MPVRSCIPSVSTLIGACCCIEASSATFGSRVFSSFNCGILSYLARHPSEWRVVVMFSHNLCIKKATRLPRWVADTSSHLIVISRHMRPSSSRRKIKPREKSGKLSRFIHQDETMDAMNNLDNLHGHFADQITTRRCIGKLYWPTRHKDIFVYCRSCPMCQMIKPLRTA